jgi:hypothetical protein
MYPYVSHAAMRGSLLVDRIGSMKFTLIRDGRGDEGDEWEGGAARGVETGGIMHVLISWWKTEACMWRGSLEALYVCWGCWSCSVC